MGEKADGKGFDKPSYGHVCLKKKNFAASVKISTAAFLKPWKPPLSEKTFFCIKGSNDKFWATFYWKGNSGNVAAFYWETSDYKSVQTLVTKPLTPDRMVV